MKTEVNVNLQLNHPTLVEINKIANAMQRKSLVELYRLKLDTIKLLAFGSEKVPRDNERYWKEVEMLWADILRLEP